MKRSEAMRQTFRMVYGAAPTLHVGFIPDALDDLVVHVPGRVHPSELETWLATLLAVRAQVTGETRPYEIACNHPLLADLFALEDVVVWSRAGRSRRLSEHPRLIGLTRVGAGQVWRTVEEDWVDHIDMVALAALIAQDEGDEPDEEPL